MGGHTRPPGLLDRAGEGISLAVPILGDGDADALAVRVAAEVVHAEVAAGVGLEECAVLTLIVQGEVEVIRAGQLLLGADQVAELQVHGVAGLEGRLGGLRQLLAIVVHQLIADAPGGDDLIVGHAVLLHLDDVAARGQAGNGDRAVLRHSHTIVGETVEGHGIAHGRAGHGDGAAAFGLEAVGSALIAQIEQDVVLRIQNTLLILGDGGVHAVEDHVRLDARAVAAHRHHEHAGALRPDGGELLAGGAALTLLMDHGVVGHQHDGRTGLVGGHGGHVAVYRVRGDGHHVAGIAVDVDDPIAHIGQGHLGVHKALDSEPVAEGVQLERLAHRHALVALGIDVQVDVSAVIHVLLEAVDRVLGEARIADVQILRRQGDGIVRAPALIVPVGHAVGVLHAVEIVRVLIHAVGDGVGLRIAAHGLDVGVHIVLGQRTHGDSGARRNGKGHVHASLAADGETVVRGGGLLRGGRIEGGLGHRVGRDRGLHGIAYHEDAAGINLAPAVSRSQLRGAHLVVGGGDLHIQGVVRAQHPAGVHGDLIDALDLGRVLAGLDRQGQAAVAVVVGVIALHPVVAHGQRQGIGGIGDRHIRQQVGVALDAINIGIQLEILDLRVMETAEGQLGLFHRVHIHRDRQDAENDGDTAFFRHIRRQIICTIRLRSGKGHCAVLCHHSAADVRQRAVFRIDPCQLGTFQRGDLLIGFQRLHRHAAIVTDAIAHHGHIHRRLGLYRQAVQLGISLLPNRVIIQCRVVLIQEEIHNIAGIHLRLCDGVAGIALPAGSVGVIRQYTVMRHRAVDGKAAVPRLFAENSGDKTAAAYDQIVRSRLLGKSLTEGQLMGADQHVQGGHAVHLVGKAVLLRQIRRHGLLLREAVEICARRLRADGHLRRGNHRRVRRDHRNSIGGGGNSRRGVLALAAGLLCVAAADGQHRAVRHGDRRRAAVGGLAHRQIDLVLLVGCGGRDSDLLHALRQLQGIAGGVLVEFGRQLTGAEAQGRQAGVVHRRPVAADVRAAIEGKHDADLIAVSQFAVGHGKFFKAAVGEPVVQRAHPAAALAAVKLAQSRIALGDLADITLVRAYGGVARRTQRAVYAAHHGGIRRQGHVGVHQRTLHLIILDVGIRGVLHDDVDTAEAAFAPLGHFGPHGGGDQAQRHDQCQEERNYAFLHLLFPPCDFLCSLYKRLSALLPLSPFRKRRWERPGLASPTLMES